MKLSIITINRNNAEGLKRTLDSVKTQTYQGFEHIIIDGASTDDSVKIIESYIRDVSCMKYDVLWVSEPDTGIYNAMNRGVRKVHGDYVLMLNSGDYLVDELVLERIVPELDGTDIIQGNIIKVGASEEQLERGYGKSDITFIDVMKNHFLHQASFCRRELFDKYGYFDESYKINGDTVFYAKCLGFGNATFRYVNQSIAYFDTTGISADPNGKWAILRKEEDERYEQMFSQRMWDLFYKEEKKIKLYDKLHAHRWSWYMTMAIARLVNLLHRAKWVKE